MKSHIGKVSDAKNKVCEIMHQELISIYELKKHGLMKIVFNLIASNIIETSEKFKEIMKVLVNQR